MPWKQQGGGSGGPWGGGGSGGGNGGGQGPWGGKPAGGGGGGGGGGGVPPDLEELIRKGQDRFKTLMPGGFGGVKGILLGLLIVVFVWLLSGLYRVQPGENGIELMFGKYVNTTEAGLNFWAPWPVGSVMRPNVEKTNQINVGFRSLGAQGRTDTSRDVPEESLMLTGDQNIIDIDFVVQWRIKSAKDFLFNIRDPESTVKLAAESSIREIVGQTPLEEVLATKRTEVETKTRDVLQRIMDDYKAGVFIAEVKMQKVDPPQKVIDAFNDVQRARQDKERQQNEAEAYRNDIVPKAKGEASRQLEQAAAYRERLIKEADGEAKRFVSVYEAYLTGKDVTLRRLYLERMQDVLGKADKVIVDKGQGGPGVVPYLPLPEIKKRSQGSTVMTNLRYIVAGIVIIVIGLFAFSSVYTVHETKQALILEFGQPRDEETAPGLHFKLPWQTATYYDKRVLSLDPPAQEIILSDQKRINVDAFVRYLIVSPKQFRLRANTEANFVDIFGRILNSAVRAEVGRVLLADMLSAQRDRVMARITTELKRQSTDFGIVVVDVRIGRTDLPPTTSESVYNRMRSQRVAQASKLRAEGAEIKARIQAEADRERTVLLAEAQRKAQILRGEGEGQQTRILNGAFGKDPDFFAFYRSMEAYGAALGAGTTMVLSPDSEFFRFFNDLPGRQ